MTELPRRVTKWSTPELLEAFAVGYRAVIGGEPSRAALAILWGQATIECGRDGKYCYSHNTGNVRGISPAGRFQLVPGAYEFGLPGQLPANAIIITPPKGAAVPPGQICYLLPSKLQKFRAYESFAEGCADKLAVIKAMWPGAIAALVVARGPEAARAYIPSLVPAHGPKYFTGDPSPYALSVLSLAGECLRKTADSAWPLPPPPDTHRHALDVQPVEVTQAADFVATLADTQDEEPKA